MILFVAGCAARTPTHPKPPPTPAFAGHTATLNITNGIKVLGAVSLPQGFVPAWPPLWLLNGNAIGVAGVANGKTAVIGFSGADFSNREILATDFGPGATGGRIAAVAANPNGMTLATVVAQPMQDQLAVVLRDLISSGKGHSVATFGGRYDLANLTWLDNNILALALRSATSAPAQTLAEGDDSPASGDGLYLINVSGAVQLKRLAKLGCALSPLDFSPNRLFAVGGGDAATPPVVIDLHNQVCHQIGTRAPLRVLGWAPTSDAFVYATAAAQGRSMGVYRYDLATGASKLIAVSSSAAAYANDGTVIALGNSQLSWRRVSEAPNAAAKAQIALFDPHQPEIKLNSLGFQTLPALLARSTMAFSTASNNAMIDTYIPGMAGPLRELIEYSYPTRSAFVIASGPERGAVLMSWSPNGRTLALVDGDENHSMLTVLKPPR
ncbi:MAG: hypothetical protein ACREQN_10385 [Candidatus Binataceae bacterium]